MASHPTEYDLVQEAAAYIRSRMPFAPKVGIILGTGWNAWAETLEMTAELSTRGVPHMIPPGVASHKGRILFTQISELPVVILAGRVHYYEGYDIQEVVRPVRILQALGCTHLVITNAAGGLNPEFEAGDIVLIRDHINLMYANPLRGPNEERWGTRFPDMTQAYDPTWKDFALQQAAAVGTKIHTGVYAGNAGPSLETPAEYEYLHRIGADLVGMSAVPEVIAANHMGLKVLAVSVVSNMCYPSDRIIATTVEEMIRTVETNARRAGALVQAALAYCH